MMAEDAERKRAYVADLYSGPNWKKRVAQMPDDRITAIYLDHQGPEGKRPDHDESTIPEPTQVRLDISSIGSGPHANEDEFEVY